MYVCLHPVPYNSNHVHVGTNSYLLDAKDKMKQFTYSVHVRNLLSNTMQASLDHYMFLGQNCSPTPPALSQHFAL